MDRFVDRAGSRNEGGLMVDFGAMLAGAHEEEPIEPRDLHSQLKKSGGYGYLRDVQAQVLTAWHDRRDERDIVIKVNTGGGKTIDGLIVLQSYINEGHGPALYVAPSNYLVNQVLREACNLGIKVTQNVDSALYLNSEAIGVINAYELVNGRTKFSNRRVSRAPAPIGAVVVDDAHAAIATTRNQLSVTIERDNPAFTELLDLFEDDLRTQSANSYLDVRDDRRGAPIRVPFWSWRRRLDEARTILRTQTGLDQSLFFDWPAIADILELCRVVFSNREVTITPHCPPIDYVTSFVDAHRRVFLTATLADDSLLVTDFGAAAPSVEAPITPVTAGDIGERMILAPQEINPGLPADKIRTAIVGLSREYNTVVLVPSEKWAENWEPHAAVVAVGDDVQVAVERLRTEPHVGLVVLVNRYDGIDLPNDACRVLVLDGLPEAFSPEERLDAMLRKGLSSIDDRQVQRIEQGVGRAVRSNEDHCVVFLLGPRLAQLTVDPRTLPRFSPATQAQLRLSREVATQINSLPLRGILGAARQALDRDESWVALALKALRNIPPQPGYVSPSSVARRNAFVAATRGDLGGACTILQEAIDMEEDPTISGILLELQATYRDALDPHLAQQTLVHAREKNAYVTKPLNGLTYTPLKVQTPQTDRCTERLSNTFSTPAQLRLEFESVAGDLKFDEFRTEEFEEAMRRAAFYIGLGSQRPEHDANVGPDNLWALGENRFWVIEAKTGAKSPAIGKRDMAQLSQSMAWFGQRYDPWAMATPVMVHRSVKAYPNATPDDGMKVMTERGLGQFAASLKAFAAGLAEATWTDPETVGRLLAGHALGADALPAYLENQHGVYNKGGV